MKEQPGMEEACRDLPKQVRGGWERRRGSNFRGVVQGAAPGFTELMGQKDTAYWLAPVSAVLSIPP